MSGSWLAQLHRRAQAVVLVARRHLDVDHGDVGPVRQRPAQEVLGVAGLRHHVEAGLVEQPHDALAQEDVVLADHDAQGLRHRSNAISPASIAASVPSGSVVLGHEADGPEAAGRPRARGVRVATR